MNTDQLQILCAVMKAGSMSRAAQQLHLSQPAITQKIKALEQELGVQLLLRSYAGVRPTQAGEQVRVLAQRVLHLVGEMRQVAMQRTPRETRELRVGATPVLGGYVLPPLVQSTETEFTGLKTVLYVDRLSSLLARVADGRLHIVFTEGPLDLPGLAETEVGRDNLVLVAGAESPHAEPSTLSVAEWLQLPHVLCRPACGLLRNLERGMEALGHSIRQLRVVAELDNLDAVKTMVEAGAGVTWVPQRVVLRELRSGAFVTLTVRGTRVPCPYVAVVHADRAPAPEADHLVRLVRARLSRRRAGRPAGPVGEAG